MLEDFKIIAFTHKLVDLEKIGHFHLDDTIKADRLGHLKSQCQLHELMYLSTCNRVEFMIVRSGKIDTEFLRQFFSSFAPDWDANQVNQAVRDCVFFEGEMAIRHLFYIAASIDSLVIGEREIITQVRNAFEWSREAGLAGDTVRLAMRHTIETAKDVFTRTGISQRSVSVVSLAYRQMRELNAPLNSRVLIVGAGETNTTMSRFLKKHGYENFTVFNRTLSKAETLAAELGGRAMPLSELENYEEGFDILLTCTGSSDPVITPAIYSSLVKDDTAKKIVIDLAVPYDLDSTVPDNHSLHYIEIKGLRSIAQKNIKARENELKNCLQLIEEHIDAFVVSFNHRAVEKAMGEVPQQVKDIKQFAIDKVFAKDLENMDDQSKDVLDKILSYMEKKYISIPMKMAKEIMKDELNKPRK